MSNIARAPLFRRLDACDVIRLAKRQRIVIVAPHPDDETLGCGLLIARASRAGLPVAVVALTDGQASHPCSRQWPAKRLGRLRRSELSHALARLGASSAQRRFLGWSDGRVLETGKALNLRYMLRALSPGLVLAASPADHHADHKAGWALVRAALRGTDIPLVSYAVWSRSSGTGKRAHDLALASKRWAMAAHRSQTSDYISDDPQGFTFSPSVLAPLIAEAEQFSIVRTRYDRMLANV